MNYLLIAAGFLSGVLAAWIYGAYVTHKLLDYILGECDEALSSKDEQRCRLVIFDLKQAIEIGMQGIKLK